MTHADRATGIDDRCISHPASRRAVVFGAGALDPGEPVEGGRLTRLALDGLPGDSRELRGV